MSMAEPTAWNDQLLTNPHAVADKRSRVQKMFAAIAPSYDLNNRLHSMWMDQAWRRKAVKLANLTPTDRVVDVACGTGDLTIEFMSCLVRMHGGKAYHSLGDLAWSISEPRTVPGNAIGIDFTYEMLPIARSKTPRIHTHGVERNGVWDGWYHPIQYMQGDAQSLPLPNQSSDVVSIAFGIRNVQDPALAIREFYRVLKPGGRLIILEFSLPTNPVLRGLYNFYFRKILPRTATLISGDKTGAYKYLPESVNTFIGRDEMSKMMTGAGFTNVEQFPMTFGVCICYRGLKE